MDILERKIGRWNNGNGVDSVDNSERWEALHLRRALEQLGRETVLDMETAVDYE